MSGPEDSFERTIWTFWEQGFSTAPPLVQACLHSWQRCNPTWRVIALDRGSLGDWLDLDSIVDFNRSDITVQKMSAISRLCLLRRYGGVWTDATVYCLKPLDTWLPQQLQRGFFAFRWTNMDRLAGNWFLASRADDPFLGALHERFVGMWRKVRFTNQDTVFGQRMRARLEPLLCKNAKRAAIWANPLLLRTLKFYPYLIFHYTMNALIYENAALRAQWESTPGLDAGPPHNAQFFAQMPDGLEKLKAESNDWLLQKLNWRFDSDSPYWRGALAEFARLTERPFA